MTYLHFLLQKNFNKDYITKRNYIPDMSSKRKSQPTRIREQHQENELQASPLPSPEMDTEKGVYCYIV